ncbi:hypothetical protein GUJ93_ZPchr0303g11322 [Zizania palustris]|uniref:Uncharacterized protein n=1 Tax=Zizania palustris TaxID=103762 RepID=A0A8J5QUK1_ZIZPA|nr:hypothetical protein GUJ93_ZPchr0303g11322 [Zizania palustris]
MEHILSLVFPFFTKLFDLFKLLRTTRSSLADRVHCECSSILPCSQIVIQEYYFSIQSRETFKRKLNMLAHQHRMKKTLLDSRN